MVMNEKIRDEIVIEFIRDHPGAYIREVIRGLSGQMCDIVVYRTIRRLLDAEKITGTAIQKPGENTARIHLNVVEIDLKPELD